MEQDGGLTIRPERPEDIVAIRAVVGAAFAGAEHSSGTEAAIVDGLRAASALTVSLVAILGDELVGHVAFSPVAIADEARDWFGLGPVAVQPDRQRRGIGDALIRDGLRRLREAGAHGCVVLGEPAYYRRFGFVSDPMLRFPGPPPGYFQRLVLQGESPSGIVRYHPAFDVE